MGVGEENIFRCISFNNVLLIFITESEIYLFEDLAKEDIKSVFEAFGNVKSCELVPSVDGKHRGYGFLEYETLQSCMVRIMFLFIFILGF